ncbi:hypothetical protein [Streptomyces celluloflavus]|uniref:Uncharacterized protein n=1 Tax=Streptomyces celluloflavus TaxID=58344 RepID=A0ABW7RHT0_9ACTN|nr:hypothetical protein OG717_20045 [Streptomyces celluloflavus]
MSGVSGMSDVSDARGETDGAKSDDVRAAEAAQHLEELKEKVREANRQSANRPR